MEEIGIVEGIEGHIAKVLVPKKSICSECTAGTCALSDAGAEIEAINEAEAKVGQKVRVILRPYSYLKGSLIIYGIPVLALVLGAVLGKEYFSGFIKGLDPEGVSALFGFGGLFLSLIFVKIWSVLAGKNTEYKPIVVEIIE